MSPGYPRPAAKWILVFVNIVKLKTYWLFVWIVSLVWPDVSDHSLIVWSSQPAEAKVSLSNHSNPYTHDECCEYVVIRVQFNENDETFHILTVVSGEHVAT